MLSDEFVVREMLKWISALIARRPAAPRVHGVGEHCVLTPSRRTGGTDLCMFRSKRSRPSQLHGRLTPSETRARSAKNHQPSFGTTTPTRTRRGRSQPWRAGRRRGAVRPLSRVGPPGQRGLTSRMRLTKSRRVKRITTAKMPASSTSTLLSMTSAMRIATKKSLRGFERPANPGTRTELCV